MKNLRALGWILLEALAMGILIAAAVSCQTAKAPAYTPTEVQSLRLQLLQRDARTAKQEFDRAYAALMNQAIETKKENKWPDATLFDPDRLQFSAPPAAMPAVAPVQPPPPAKPVARPEPAKR